MRDLINVAVLVRLARADALERVFFVTFWDLAGVVGHHAGHSLLCVSCSCSSSRGGEWACASWAIQIYLFFDRLVYHVFWWRRLKIDSPTHPLQQHVVHESVVGVGVGGVLHGNIFYTTFFMPVFPVDYKKKKWFVIVRYSFLVFRRFDDVHVAPCPPYYIYIYPTGIYYSLESYSGCVYL